MTIDTPFAALQASGARHVDERGHLEVLHEQGNLVLKRSFSRAGVFRGLHRQRPPQGQTKLIRVTKGRILDFVIDPDAPGSLLYCKTLSTESDWIRIDPQYAHGFYALQDCGFEYICDGEYSEAAEQSFSITAVLRDQLGIRDPLLSPKDAAATPLVPAALVRLD